MKILIFKLLAAAVFAATLSGCGAIRHESAMEWMQRQPWTSDAPT